MTRDEIRESVMQIIFQMEANDSFDLDDINYMEESIKPAAKKQAVDTLRAFTENVQEIDTKISENLTGWTIKRLAKTDLAILRLAVCEMLYMKDIPKSVSINEAVELAKEYGDEKSYAFINSVLGKVYRSLL